MDKIIQFPKGTPTGENVGTEPNEEVIAFLKELYERAKSGEIQAAAVCYVAPGNQTVHGWQQGREGTISSHLLMASICYLQTQYAAAAKSREEFERSGE